MDLLSKLNALSGPKPTDPRAIFMSLPRKNNDYAYARDVQSDVWEKWYRNRSRKNTIIKMNTGSGKTVVGLMILQSSLNEDVGPAVYVVPDNFLIQQVINEANCLGIKATDDKEDYSFKECKAILVTSIHTLVNGKSVFGMRDSNNIPIGSIIIDDVHACMDIISKQFTITVNYNSKAYSNIIAILDNSLSSYDPRTYSEIVEEQSPKTRMLVPFWIWQQKEQEIYRALNSFYDEDKNIYFSLPLLRNCFATCNCVITARSIEISPLGNDMDLIRSFQRAQRRIFMSATLADDSVFISALGLKKSEVDNIITPNCANDIGARLIIFPKHLNNQIQDDEIRAKAAEIARKHNVVVIVPSYERAVLWRRFTNIIVDKDNILDTVGKLKCSRLGLVVFVNRYDGIDLPDDACRMLIIDSLPPLNKEYDKYFHSICMDSNLLVREQMQRIEQGMGRGVRSSTDNCCIVFMGTNLADVLIVQKGYQYFSSATAEQYKLSKQLWDMIKDEKELPTIEDIFTLADLSLNKIPDWIQQCKKAVSNVVYSASPQIDSTEIALRAAFESYLSGNACNSTEIINQEIGKLTDDDLKGYLMQIKATYMNLHDQVSAQKILLSAKKLNRSVLSPIEGFVHQKIKNVQNQAQNIVNHIQSSKMDQNVILIHLQKVFDDFSFQSDSSVFERAVEEIGRLLGFYSVRPDLETKGIGPDNLWALGNGTYWVIECKNESETQEISKDYCNQLGGSIRWFEKEYPNDHAEPIMIHPSISISKQATPDKNMRIINEECLNRLKKSIEGFYKALAVSTDLHDTQNIGKLLNNYHLAPNDLLQIYTEGYKRLQS